MITFPCAQSGLEALLNRAATAVVVGWSPTGNGHMDRLLDVLKISAEEGRLRKDDVILVHLPPTWNGNRTVLPSSSLDEFTRVMQKQKIHVAFAKSNGSAIHGDYQPTLLCGQSDRSRNSRINQSFANNPLRRIACWSGLNKGMLLARADSKCSISPRAFFYEKALAPGYEVSAQTLMQKIVRHIPCDKIKVLTDMDPALQKAAANCGIPGHQRVDQQNHGSVLFPRTNPKIPDTRMAFLSKAVSGFGERVSEMQVHGDPSRGALNKTAQCLDYLGSGDTVFRRGVSYLLNYGRELTQSNASMNGILVHPDLRRTPERIETVVYIYLNGSSSHTVMKIIREKLDATQIPNALFVFCGSETIDEESLLGEPKLDPLALCYAMSPSGRVHGIAAAGAGIVGEFSFFRRIGSQAKILLIPFEEQYEQQRNAEYLHWLMPETAWIAKEPQIGIAMERFLPTLATCQEPVDFAGFRSRIDLCIREKRIQQRQTSDLLFLPPNTNPEDSPLLQLSNYYSVLETALRADEKMILKRKEVKFLCQWFDAFQQYLAEGKSPLSFLGEVRLTANGPALRLSFREMRRILENPEDLVLLSMNKRAGDPLNAEEALTLQRRLSCLRNEPGLAHDLALARQVLKEIAKPIAFSSLTRCRDAENLSQKVKDFLEELGRNVFHGY